jgi:hypothetical protein
MSQETFFSLDPKASAERRAEKRATEEERPSLEPSFPFHFDPFYFGADREVGTESEKSST